MRAAGAEDWEFQSRVFFEQQLQASHIVSYSASTVAVLQFNTERNSHCNFYFPSSLRNVYILQMFFVFLFVFCFFPSAKNMRQPFSGTAERIFMKLLPNGSGEHVLHRRTQMDARPLPIIFGG